MENEMLMPVILAGIFTLLAVLGVVMKKGLYARLGFFLFGGMVMTFNLLAMLSGEGGALEIVSVGMFACQTILMYPIVPEEVNFSDEAVKTLALRVTTTVMLINATAVWLVLAVGDLPQILAVFHGILSIIMAMRLGMITKGGVTKT
ncbi:MAG: hypothetical protein CL845_03065 [Crocinitomicaceae bacterium]|nr:hypothetical protein [Crocinitomicaceae bacterium]|tara:strand:+ start:4070 stop:4510 length:441 start_codon:yes stop_codon:yes gene_type:complete